MKDIVDRLGINRTIAFRLVHTLHQRGFLRSVSRHQYQSNVRLAPRRRFRIGYAAQAEFMPFSAAVTEGLRGAADRAEIDLIQLDNRYSAKFAVKNAGRLIAERVDLGIEFQTFEKAAPVISAMFHQAGIPLIAVDIPHPGATYYGVDNYRVGLSGGSVLGNWAKQHWGGDAGEVLLMGLEAAGALPNLRTAGMEASLREVLRGNSRRTYVHLDCNGEFSPAQEMIRRRLRRGAPGRTLIGGVNDPSVLGAIAAFEEAGHGQSCAGLGLGGIPDARAEIARPGSRLIGSIAFFPERYGNDLVNLALKILNKQHVSPALYAAHQLITAKNVQNFYPDYGRQTDKVALAPGQPAPVLNSA